MLLRVGLSPSGRKTELVGRLRREECAVGDDGIRQFLKGRDVHDPDRAAMRGRNELLVPWVDLEIMDRNRRKAVHETLPCSPSIGGYVGPYVRTDKQNIRIDRIFLDDVHEVGRPSRKACCDRAERSSVVVRHEDVGGKVIGPVAVEGDVDTASVVIRRLHAADVGAVRDIVESVRELGPGPTVVLGHPYTPVVRTHVQPSPLDRRLVEGDDGGVVLSPRNVGRESPRRARRHVDLVRIRVGEVRRDGLERRTPVRALHDHAARRVEMAPVVGRLQKRRVPVPAHVIGKGVRGRPLAQASYAPIVLVHALVHEHDDRILVGQPCRSPVGALQALTLTGRQVQSPHVALLRLRPDDVRIDRVLRADESVASADARPVIRRDVTSRKSARTAPRSVVLQPSAHPIGDVHVQADVVELAHGHVVQVRPVPAPVVRDRDAAVVAHDDPLGVVRVDPHRVVVHMYACGRLPEGTAPIVGYPHRRRGEVDTVRILRVHTDL